MPFSAQIRSNNTSAELPRRAEPSGEDLAIVSQI